MNHETMKISNGSSENGVTLHWTSKFLESSCDYGKYAIVVLNRPICVADFEKYWNGASLRCCVDGGMNRFLEFSDMNSSCSLSPPDVFSGDFDSCNARSMDFAQSTKCQIIKTPDQNETDFTKALRTISSILKEKDIDSVLVVCETSGRLDQIMANINTLFKSKKILPHISVQILSSNSLSWLLHPGTHVIDIPREIVTAKRWCALVPFCRTQVTTTGLKWNLDNSFLEFGGMVSSSNTYQENATEVEVKTDNAVLWTMGTSAIED